MNNNQLVLEALENLKNKKQELLENYTKDVHQPKLKAANEYVLNYLRENVNEKIESVDYTIDRLSIGEDRLTVSRKRDWRSNDRDKLECEINWYGSSATLSDTTKLQYLQILGSVAQMLPVIQMYMTDEKEGWPSLLKETYDTLNYLHNDVYNATCEINGLKSKISEDEKDQYKKIGAKVNISKYSTANWNSDTDLYELVNDAEHSIKLQYGRSKWDYVYATSFEVIDMGRGKVTLNYTRPNEYEKPSTIVVTQKRFEEFVDAVYYWNTEGAAKQSKQNEERVERYSQRVNS